MGRTKVTIEPKLGPISLMIDEFFRIRRMCYNKEYRYFFKYGKYIIEASEENDTPMGVYDKYRLMKKKELENSIHGIDGQTEKDI